MISLIILVIIIIYWVVKKYILKPKKPECKAIKPIAEPPHHCEIDDDPTKASISCIELPDDKKLYISDERTAKCPYIRRVFSIDSILSITQRRFEKYPEFSGEHKHFQLDDLPSADITKCMDESNKFIEKQLADDKKIIVHCMAGISRSVSLVLSYLMYKYKMSYEKALATVRKNRPIANPNEGFMRQLRKKYEYTGMGEIVTGIGKYN